MNWNGQAFLDNCLSSILNQTYPNYEVIVVDNGSTDGSQAYIKGSYPQVRLIENAENLGFAGGTNSGIRVAKGDYIITFNNDTKTLPNFIEEMVKVADADECTGMVAAKMVFFDNINLIDNVGLKASRNGMAYGIANKEEDTGRYDVISSIFAPSAGAGLYKQKMLSEIGLFDEDFFAYYEDIDLAWRGQLAGWKCLTAPKAVVQHVHSGSWKNYSKLKIYYTHRNKIWVLIKIWPIGTILKNLHWLILFDIMSIIYSLIFLKSTISFKAKFDAFKKLRLMLKKRRSINTYTRLSRREFENLLVSFENPFATLSKKIQ